MLYGVPSPLGGCTGPDEKLNCFDFWHNFFFKTKQDNFHPGPVETVSG